MTDGATFAPSLPSGWTWAAVENLASGEPNSITDGPFGSHLKTSHYTARGPRVVRLQNVGDGEFIDAHAHISEEHYERLSKHAVKAGDLVIAMLGEHLPRACLVPATLGPAIVKADCAKFTPHPNGPNRRYLMYALNSPVIRDRIVVHGVGRPRLNLSDVRAIRLPLAPRPEQDRIVAEIEKHFTLLDAAVTALKRVQANLKRYRASLLKAAVEGRLVPTEAELAQREGRIYETGDEVLRRAGSEESKRPHRPPSWALPEGWAWATVAQVGQVQLGRQRSPQHHNGPNMRPYLRAANITWQGFDLRDVMRMNFDSDDFARHRLLPGDLLLAEASGSSSEVGRPAVWSGEIADCCCQNTLIRVRSRLPISQFLYWHFYCDAFSGRFGEASRGVGIHHLGSAGLSSWVVGIPPLAEQSRVVAELERRVSFIDHLESAITMGIARTDRLRQAMLVDAFSGRLVPQDPRDEPASELLARIGQERQATTAATSSPRQRASGQRKRTRSDRPLLQE